MAGTSKGGDWSMRQHQSLSLIAGARLAKGRVEFPGLQEGKNQRRRCFWLLCGHDQSTAGGKDTCVGKDFQQFSSV